MIYYEETHNKTELYTVYKKGNWKELWFIILYKHKEIIGCYK